MVSGPSVLAFGARSDGTEAAGRDIPRLVGISGRIPGHNLVCDTHDGVGDRGDHDDRDDAATSLECQKIWTISRTAPCILLLSGSNMLLELV